MLCIAGALQRRRYGAELEPARLWGRTPKVFAAQTLLYRALERKDSPIESALRDFENSERAVAVAL